MANYLIVKWDLIVTILIDYSLQISSWKETNVFIIRTVFYYESAQLVRRLL